MSMKILYSGQSWAEPKKLIEGSSRKFWGGGGLGGLARERRKRGLINQNVFSQCRKTADGHRCDQIDWIKAWSDYTGWVGRVCGQIFWAERDALWGRDVEGEGTPPGAVPLQVSQHRIHEQGMSATKNATQFFCHREWPLLWPLRSAFFGSTILSYVLATSSEIWQLSVDSSLSLSHTSPTGHTLPAISWVFNSSMRPVRVPWMRNDGSMLFARRLR